MPPREWRYLLSPSRMRTYAEVSGYRFSQILHRPGVCGMLGSGGVPRPPRSELLDRFEAEDGPPSVPSLSVDLPFVGAAPILAGR